MASSLRFHSIRPVQDGGIAMRDATVGQLMPSPQPCHASYVLPRRRLADFEHRCRTDIRLLQEAYDLEDLCTFMEVAYGIASACRTVGEMGIARACESIEHAGRVQLALIDAGAASADPLGDLAREAYRLFLRELTRLRQDLYMDTDRAKLRDRCDQE